jgi:guanine nucleotide-binding protein subunit alpha
MKIIHLKGFTQDELINYRPIIHCNTLESIQALINGAKNFGYQIASENQSIAASFTSITPLNTEFNTVQANQIKKLWADDAIQKAWQRRNELQVPDVANFFV